MAKWPIPFRNIQFVPRPAPRKLKILFLALILACAAALMAIGVVRSRIQQETQAALEQAAALERQNAALEETRENLDTSAIRDIAREELGLVDPNTIIIDPSIDPN